MSSFLGGFVRRYFLTVGPTLEQNGTNGDWLLRVPVPVYVEVVLKQREIVSGQLSPEGFLRELIERVKVESELVLAKHKAAE